MKKKNIILIGMMGCGKTTIGAELSRILPDYDYVDIDNKIEKSTQKKISDIFLQRGELFFRILETEKINDFCTKEKSQIISVGGGAFENKNNRDIMFKTGIVIYLKTSPEEIYERIRHETHRPLLRKNFSVENIRDIMEKRETNYKLADIIVLTDKKTPQEIAQEIVREIND